MSWISKLLFGGDNAAPLTAPTGGAVPVGTGIIAPWADQSPLAKIAYSEILGGSTDVVDRAAAMAVAPIVRGRNIIVGALADLPLVAGRFAGSGDGDPEGEGFTPTDRQPAWLTRTKTVSTCWHRMASTIDDLIFHGWSLWALQRSEAGTILDALRVSPARWSFDQTAPLGIRVDDRPMQASEGASVVLIQGPFEGILATGADVIRGARAMERAWVGRVQNPVPMTVLHEVERNGVTQVEAQAMVSAWSTARQSPAGAVGFLPSTLNMEVYGETVADLFTEGRNNVRLDVANLIGLPASVLDGSTATSSLTYATAEGQFSQLAEYLDLWLAPIEARLSADDVCPQGQVVRFARRGLTRNAPYGNGAASADDAPAAPEIEEVAA